MTEGRVRVVGYMPIGELDAEPFDADGRVSSAAHEEILIMAVGDLEDVTVEVE